MNNEKLMREIRKNIFDYSTIKEIKAKKIIEKLKQRIIQKKNNKEFYHWMYAAEL